jgi:hypothetical protein
MGRTTLLPVEIINEVEEERRMRRKKTSLLRLNRLLKTAELGQLGILRGKNKRN